MKPLAGQREFKGGRRDRAFVAHLPLVLPERRRAMDLPAGLSRINATAKAKPPSWRNVTRLQASHTITAAAIYTSLITTLPPHLTHAQHIPSAHAPSETRVSPQPSKLKPTTNNAAALSLPPPPRPRHPHPHSRLLLVQPVRPETPRRRAAPRPRRQPAHLLRQAGRLHPLHQERRCLAQPPRSVSSPSPSPPRPHRIPG